MPELRRHTELVIGTFSTDWMHEIVSEGKTLMVTTVGREFRLQMEGYGLTTAEIHYHMPDHPSLLQLFVWQEYDLAPDFPELKGFLDYWGRELDGALHSVRVVHHSLIKPSEWRAVDGIIAIH
jgi:uncharacterized protein Usg